MGRARKADEQDEVGKRAYTSSRGEMEQHSESADDPFLQSLCYGGDEDSRSISSHKPKDRSPWYLFIHLLINPKLGWRRIKKSNYVPEDFARILFYPLLALMSVCRFADLAYYQSATLAPLLQRTIAAFVAGFAGYYAVMLLARTFLPTHASVKISGRFGHLYIMSVMSALALATSIAELFPWLGLLLVVMPIYIAYVTVKGVAMLRIPEPEQMPARVLLPLLCIGVPIGIYALLCAMMPQVQ